MKLRRILPFVVGFVALATTQSASAVCVNKFFSKPDGPRQVVTLLTGKLTFQEAQALDQAINAKQAPPVEWVDDKGKTISKQFGLLKVVRPMPVGCDGKTSGVVMIVTFPTGQQPSSKMQIKFDASAAAVTFEQQKE